MGRVLLGEEQICSWCQVLPISRQELTNFYSCFPVSSGQRWKRVSSGRVGVLVKLCVYDFFLAMRAAWATAFVCPEVETWGGGLTYNASLSLCQEWTLKESKKVHTLTAVFAFFS